MSQKCIYQNKAQTEKEITRVKMSEHLIQEVQGKNPIPQKRVQTQKRIQKALKKENIKTEPYNETLPKIEYDDLNEYITKKRIIGNGQLQQPNLLDNNPFPDLFSNLSKFSLPELISRAASKDGQLDFAADASYLMGLLDTTKKIGEKSSELLLDFLTFHSKQDSNRCLPQGGLVPSTRNQAINDALMNCLQFDGSNDFNLDAFNNEAYSAEIPLWN